MTVNARVALACAVLLCSGLAFGQGYPDRPVRMLVGFTAGGSADLSARAISDGLAASLGKPVLIENRPGAGSIIAATAVARAKRISYASVGIGSSLHLMGEMLKDRAKIDAVHIPYKGSVPALADIMGGRVEFMFDNLITALPQVKGGKIRALAVTSPKRTPQLPEVPTMAEAGFDNFETSVWFAVFAPRKTSRPVVERIAAAITASLSDPKITARFVPLSMDVLKSESPEAAAAFFRRDVQNWKATVAKAGVRIEKN